VLGLLAGASLANEAATEGAAATEVTVQGTYSAGAESPGGTWEAIVVPETGRLRGAMTYADGNVIALDGTVVDGKVEFEIKAPGRVTGHLTGYLNGTTISGTYTVGTAQGTWTGTASAALPAN
jgi:hypothetical protein